MEIKQPMILIEFDKYSYSISNVKFFHVKDELELCKIILDNKDSALYSRMYASLSDHLNVCYEIHKDDITSKNLLNAIKDSADFDVGWYIYQTSSQITGHGDVLSRY